MFLYAEKEQSTNVPEDEQLHKFGSRCPQVAWSEGEQTDDFENRDQILTEKDALANAFVWSTTTQR